MKQAWGKLAIKIDAMTLRERAMAFGAAAALLLFLLFFLLFSPMLAKQKALSASLVQQRQQIEGIDAEIVAKIAAHGADPDLQDKQQLERIKRETARMGNLLRSAQNGLVAPDRIVFLLENMLKKHQSLRLLSLKTLPSDVVGGDSAAKPATAPAAVPAPAGAVAPTLTPLRAAPLLHRHGVEVVLQGNYLEMVSYMDALEKMPAQLFWGKAELRVGQYPTATLALTLYTLSLDEKWIAL